MQDKQAEDESPRLFFAGNLWAKQIALLHFDQKCIKMNRTLCGKSQSRVDPDIIVHL